MNAFRVKFSSHSDKQVLIQSTLDRSYFLNSRTDEQVQFDKNALVIMKNQSEEDIILKIRIEKVDRAGAGIIFRSTRRPTMVLGAGDSNKIRMKAGEVFQIRGEDAVDMRMANPTAHALSV